MIKNDPESPQLLASYEDSLTKAQAAYMAADPASKEKYLQQVQMLANLVNLYAVGTDPSVTTDAQFEAKLVSMGQQNEANQSAVFGGAKS